jgi:hypothetical protein
MDSGMRADVPVAQDTGMAVDAPAMEDAGTDAGGGEDAPAMADAGPVTCFPLSGPSADLPDAIPSSFTAASPTWMRPTGEECPATGLGDVAVPFDTVCYENDTGADIDVLFEVLVGEEDLRPAVVIYDGTAIPSDAMGCAAVSSDLVIDAAEAFYTVPDGAMITFVATVQEPGTGDFQFVITPE